MLPRKLPKAVAVSLPGRNMDNPRFWLRIAFIPLIALLFTALSGSTAMPMGMGGWPPAPPPPPPPPAPAATAVTPETLIDTSGTPVDVAVSPTGRLFVTDSLRRSVRIFSNNGVHIDDIQGIADPLGIVAASDGRIYVGDGAEGTVSAYDGAGSLLFRLGSGVGEFLQPTALALDAGGTVYVADSRAHEIRVYTPAGSSSGSFGATDLQFPTGIAVDGASRELYVTDNHLGRIKIFSPGGAYSREIDISGEVLRPQGIVLSGDRIFVADAYNSSIAEYTKDGVFVQRVGTYGSALGQYRIPLGLALDADGKLFVANYNNRRVEVLGVGDAYTALSVTPSLVSLTATDAETPVPFALNVDANIAGTSWTVRVSEPWLQTAASAGTTPAQVVLTANPAGLANGTYTGTVTLVSPNGTESIAHVMFTVAVRKVLELSPASVDLSYRVGTNDYPTANVHAVSIGGSLAWTAATDVAWLNVSPGSGSTPSTITVEATDAVAGLAPGTYNGSLTVDAGDAEGSPGTVDVKLEVYEAGTVVVTSNIAEAAYSIDGPETYTGGGSYSEHDRVVPGDYTVTFSHVPGYGKPWTETFTIASGETVEIDGLYRTRPASTHVVAVSEAVSPEAAYIVDLDGTLSGSISLVDLGAVRVEGLASGDTDGDGIDEVALAFSDGTAAIYDENGVLLESMVVRSPAVPASPAGTQMGQVSARSSSGPSGSPGGSAIRNGGASPAAGGATSSAVLEIALHDMDNDGRADLVVGALAGGNREFAVYGYDATNAWTSKGTILSLADAGQFAFAVGDVDGDGIPELIVADVNTVVAYEVVGNGGGNVLWNRGNPFAVVPTVAAGDIMGNGMAAIVLGNGTVSAGGTAVTVLDGTGNDAGTVFDALAGTLESRGVRVACGDFDGDSFDEILVGNGPSAPDPSLVHLYSGNGAYSGITLDPTPGTTAGLRVAAGTFNGGAP